MRAFFSKRPAFHGYCEIISYGIFFTNTVRISQNHLSPAPSLLRALPWILLSMFLAGSICGARGIWPTLTRCLR